MSQTPADHAPNFRRQWLIPIVVLMTTALAIFWAFYSLDFFKWGGGASQSPTSPFDRYFRFDPDHITDAVSSLAGMVAAVFGIVITVVSIVVQLSAERYTGVARMFLRDRINL